MIELYFSLKYSETRHEVIFQGGNMKYVFICSPYRPIGKDLETELKNNIDQAKRACRLAVSRGLIPLAPHLYFDDNDPQERKFGQQVGKEWMRCVSEVWVVGDRISSGMEEELKLARLWSIPIKKVKFHNEQEKLYPDRNTVEQLRKEYPAGCRVKLLKMDDIQAPPIGTEGTVVHVDDTGSICVRWDTGSGLNVVYGVDRCVKI